MSELYRIMPAKTETEGVEGVPDMAVYISSVHSYARIANAHTCAHPSILLTPSFLMQLGVQAPARVLPQHARLRAPHTTACGGHWGGGCRCSHCCATPHPRPCLSLWGVPSAWGNLGYIKQSQSCFIPECEHTLMLGPTQLQFELTRSFVLGRSGSYGVRIKA